MVKRTLSRRRTNKNLIKDIIAGAFSPVSASNRIQRSSRKYLSKQESKRQELLSLLSQGKSVYVKALKNNDFRGINMKNQVLSRRVLDNAKFQNVDFTKSKLNSAGLNNVNAQGAIFVNSELKNARVDGSIFNKALFKHSDLSEINCKNTELKNAEFRDSEIGDLLNLSKSNFISCNLSSSKFMYVVKMNEARFDDCNLTNVKFNNCVSKLKANYSGVKIIRSILDNVSFINCHNLFSRIMMPCTFDESAYQQRKQSGVLKNITLVCTSPRQANYVQPMHLQRNIIFENLYIENILFRDNIDLTDCTFDKLDLRNNTQFYHAKFISCNFIDSDLAALVGHSSTYRDCTFTNCKFNKADLRASKFDNSIFKKCDLDGVKFVHTRLRGVKFYDSKLSNIDFQECDGMEGMNFEGLNLQGSRLVGITDPGLNGCNFRNANLRGVQFDFSQIHGSDFTGADLLGSNVRVAEGSNETVGIPEDQEEGRTVDTHKTFYNMNINALLNFFMTYGFEPFKSTAEYPEFTDDFIRNYSLKSLKKIITDMKASVKEKEDLNKGIESCFTQRLNTYNFSANIAGTDPKINFRTLIYYAIQYLNNQPVPFKNIYTEALIMDSTQAYGPDGMSCAAGIVERFITVMEQAASVVKDMPEYEKQEEYAELISIIANDPKTLIKNYQQEWFEFHKEGGPNAFAETVHLDTMMKDYEKFLKDKFGFSKLTGAKKEKILKIIMDDPNAGVNITRDYIENSILFFGGRVKDNRHLNYFKMLKDRFYIKNRYSKHSKKKYHKQKIKAKKTRVKKHRVKKH